MANVSVRMEDRLLEQLDDHIQYDAYWSERRPSRSEVIRVIVEEYLNYQKLTQDKLDALGASINATDRALAELRGVRAYLVRSDAQRRRMRPHQTEQDQTSQRRPRK